MGKTCLKFFARCLATFDVMAAFCYFVSLYIIIAVRGRDILEAKALAEGTPLTPTYGRGQYRGSFKSLKYIIYGFEPYHLIYLAVAIPGFFLARRNKATVKAFYLKKASRSVTVQQVEPRNYLNGATSTSRSRLSSVPKHHDCLFWFHQFFLVGYNACEIFIFVLLFGKWFELGDYRMMIAVPVLFLIRCFMTVVFELVLRLDIIMC